MPLLRQSSHLISQGWQKSLFPFTDLKPSLVFLPVLLSAKILAVIFSLIIDQRLILVNIFSKKIDLVFL